ncbi:saccharopine dehydrogenase-like oxidoreductase [Orbicella faveolata]|uniref:saccharopine dehydrogenase-like oxidoreductase n=1 Tax=Orbicella faveolata TaxID=48498 RepID=UPI0009E25A6E|nr:saccharopine dehydrogenase-like oxidoreductase [Orbicella faveolata]
MASADRQFSIVVFGASGFTGQFVVREVARNCRGKFKWAVAGRSKDKLEKVLQETADELGYDVKDVGIMVADVSDESSLNAMCSAAKIVLNCVGPYRFYGEPVVKAAVENGCHHLDISGEPEFLEKMQFQFHDQAVSAGIYIVSTCGFDSIPADMGVVFTQENFPGELCHLESFLALHSGPKGSKGHFGTYQSIIHGVASAREGNLKKLRAQLYPKPMPKFGPKLARRGFISFSREVQKWCIPFMGADPSVVRRSQRHSVEVRNKKPVQYGAYVTMPLIIILLFMFFGIFFFLLCQFKRGRKLLERYPQFFSGGFFSHEGPTREQMAESSFSFSFHGAGYSQKALQSGTLPSELDGQIETKVVGPEAGYVATPICMVQAALVILEETLPNSGGVLTPAAAFTGTSLIDRLNEHGVKFTVERCEVEE